MKIALAQFNPTVGDFRGNSVRILALADEAKECGASLAVFSLQVRAGCRRLLAAPDAFRKRGQSRLPEFLASHLYRHAILRAGPNARAHLCASGTALIRLQYRGEFIRSRGSGSYPLAVGLSCASTKSGNTGRSSISSFGATSKCATSRPSSVSSGWSFSRSRSSLQFSSAGWLSLPSQGLPYPVFYFAALVPWAYFSSALGSCTNTLASNQQVVTKVYFPRLVLPLAAVCSPLVDFCIGLILMIAIALSFSIRPPATVLLLPVLIILAVLTALAVGLWTSALNAPYREVESIIPFTVQFWMFASPVAYPSSLVPQRGRLLYGLNPMAGVIDGFRWALTGQGQPPDLMILVSAAVVVLLLIAGVFFQSMEGTVTDRI